MKKFIVAFICIAIIFGVTYKTDAISNYIVGFITDNHQVKHLGPNEYTKKDEFMYVKNVDDFTPYSYQDLKNIVYTIINNGWESFTFYCPSEYTDCVIDIQTLSVDEVTLTHINNFVHPYNSFTKLATSILDTGEITLTVYPVYTDEQIDRIDTEVTRLIGMMVKDDATEYDNIKAIHDYIVNNTKYDTKANEGTSEYASSTAYGTLFEHYATCNGYTDTMAIFLSKLGVTNYKIATTEEDLGNGNVGHIWNAVYINNKWVHLDLTWDDPVSDDGKDYLYHKYFLVNTEELKKADSGDVEILEHNFRDNVYLEFNESI